ncbi:M3 family metallopeptidase [Haloflavibacter putidus]|uniref:M3 family metallopeptidase n=1 Tax=Haloflavibacter putidus TaxID=2576776 RepID=A0A507ZX13_9FLAO|nr:M3 family metallopeptidase [Haloflavibacter putidus]TQD39305.1 M3 family metallopeptidase [Haloflavibacter putidus]
MKATTKSLGIAALILFSACQNNSEKQKEKQEITQNMPELLQKWDGPYQGVPAFDQMQVKMIKPAITKGMEMHLQQLNTISNQEAKPNFENTIVAMEKAGKPLDRAFTYYGIYSSNLSSEDFRAVQKDLAPKIADYQSQILQNEKLFQRIKSVYEQAQKDSLSKQKQRTLDLIYERFTMNGANLSKEDKQRYAEIQKELSGLYTDFSNNVLADEENYVVYLEKDQIDGLPESFVKASATSAEERDKKGKYAITNTRSSMDPFLTYSTNRELREKVWKNYYSRGDNDDKYDNKAIIAEILKLRDERVELLGYDNFASWRLQNRMAKEPEQAMDLMLKVWPAAVERAKEEIVDMQNLADKLGHDIKIKPWDYRFYAEKVRKEKYDLDSEEIKEYLVLDNLKQALFFTAGELFDYKFEKITDGSVPVFHEDVEVYEVHKKDTDSLIGLWYLDPYARQGKRSGAWATTYRSKTALEGNKPVLASNNSNFIKPAPGEPVLISWDDAETFFHEFGHALHFLSAEVDYPTLNGGVRDYTEFQSQLLERWLSTDKVINKYLRHYKTDEVIPQKLVNKIKKAATFNQGFATTEFLASALIDMKLHTANPENIDVAEFEKKTLDSLGLPEQIVMRHRTPHFGHIFSGEGYAAGYYGYLWADVLTSDAAEAFAEAPGGFYDKELAHKLVKYLFAPRNAIDPAEAYKQFRGREAKIDALMRDRGFAVPKEKQ